MVIYGSGATPSSGQPGGQGSFLFYGCLANFGRTANERQQCSKIIVKAEKNKNKISFVLIIFIFLSDPGFKIIESPKT